MAAEDGVCASRGLDFDEGSREFLAAPGTLEDSLSLAALCRSEPAFKTFLLAARWAASPVFSSGIAFASPAPDFPLSPGLRFSLGLRAVLKKDRPLSSVLLVPRGPLEDGAELVEETPTLEDRRLVIEELLLELRPVGLSSTALPDLPSALLAALSLEEAAPWPTFLSNTALAREDSRLVLLSAALALSPAKFFSLFDVLF